MDFFRETIKKIVFLLGISFNVLTIALAGRVFFFPQHLVEGLLNFRRRVCRSFWLDLAFPDPPGKTDQ